MTMMSAAGLVVGVAVLILVLSIMNGFEEELRVRVLSLLPHGVLEGQEPMDEYSLLVEKVREHPDVIDVAPYVRGSGLVIANHEMDGISYSGILPESEVKVSELEKYLITEKMDVLKPGSWNVLIGARLASKLSVEKGDRISLVLPETQFSLAGPLPRLKQLKIADIFNAGADIDKFQIYLHMEDAKILKRISGIDGIRLKVRDMFRAHEVIYDLVYSLEDFSLRGKSWLATHGNLYGAIKTQKTTMFLLLFLLIAVATFNVVSNLMMTVNEKLEDIAILKTMGADPGDILTIFIMHGALLGFTGVLTGIVLGISLSTGAAAMFGWIETIFAPGIMDEYFINYLPSRILVSDIVIVTLVSFVICLVSSVYPARKAAASLPVETLQYVG